MPMSIMIGMFIGIALGIVFNNYALGLAIGAGSGVSIGSALQQKYGKKIKMTKALKDRKWRLTIMSVITLISGIIVLALFLFV